MPHDDTFAAFAPVTLTHQLLLGGIMQMEVNPLDQQAVMALSSACQYGLTFADKRDLEHGRFAQVADHIRRHTRITLCWQLMRLAIACLASVLLLSADSHYPAWAHYLGVGGMLLFAITEAVGVLRLALGLRRASMALRVGIK